MVMTANRSWSSMQAVALSYREHRDSAPSICAKGQQAEAQRMVSLARRYGIPVEHDNSLANELSALRVGQPVPECRYREVAQVLAKPRRW